MVPTGLVMSFVSIPFWLLCIRPYARRHGAGHTAGIDIGTTAWVDWQQAREIAKKRGDGTMLACCWLFLLLAGGGPGLIFLGLFL